MFDIHETEALASGECAVEFSLENEIRSATP